MVSLGVEIMTAQPNLDAKGEAVSDLWYIPRRADGWRGRGRLYSSMTGHKQEAKAAANWGQSARKKKSNDKKHKDAAEDSRKAARPERRASREPEVAYAYMKAGQDWHSGIKKYVSRTDHFKDEQLKKQLKSMREETVGWQEQERQMSPNSRYRLKPRYQQRHNSSMVRLFTPQGPDAVWEGTSRGFWGPPGASPGEEQAPPPDLQESFLPSSLSPKETAPRKSRRQSSRRIVESEGPEMRTLSARRRSVDARLHREAFNRKVSAVFKHYADRYGRLDQALVNRAVQVMELDVTNSDLEVLKSLATTGSKIVSSGAKQKAGLEFKDFSHFCQQRYSDKVDVQVAQRLGALKLPRRERERLEAQMADMTNGMRAWAKSGRTDIRLPQLSTRTV